MKETKKWMVVPYEIKEEENNQKINESKLDTIIKDVNLKDDNKVNDYNNQLKKNLNKIVQSKEIIPNSQSIQSIPQSKSNDPVQDQSNKSAINETEKEFSINQLKKQIETLDKIRKNDILNLQHSLDDLLENREFIDESLYRQPYASTRLAKKRRRLNKLTDAPKISRVVKKISKPEISSNTYKTSIRTADKILNWDHELSLLGDSLDKFNFDDSKMTIE